MKKQHKETQLFRHDAERNHPCSNRAIPLTNFDQLRGRQTLCVGFEPPVTAVLIVRYNGWKGFDTGCLGVKSGSFRTIRARKRARPGSALDRLSA
jgi:hypothetical protein